MILDPRRDAVAFRHRLGVLVPATNTAMAQDLWRLLVRNQRAGRLRGVGLNFTPVSLPSGALATDTDRIVYGERFLAALPAAVETALVAEPSSLLLGMSLEHVVDGLEAVRSPVRAVIAQSGLHCAAWPDGLAAALAHLGARRVGLLTPFDESETDSAARMIESMGFDVVARVGLACPDARAIARIPEWAKERAILEELAPPGARVDAIVQCGSNMSVLDACARLEPMLGLPILGINAVSFWHALRSQGIRARIGGGGRLLREA
jgi:maleate isomerase